ATISRYRCVVNNQDPAPERGGSIQSMAIQEPTARPLTARDPRLAPWRSFLLAHAPGRRIRMGLLAEEVLLSKSGVTRLVDRLVNDGLVERSTCSTDARGAE